MIYTRDHLDTRMYARDYLDNRMYARDYLWQFVRYSHVSYSSNYSLHPIWLDN